MTIRDDIDEARRLWVEHQAIMAAKHRATSEQVYEALDEAAFNAMGAFPALYSYGRTEGACRSPGVTTPDEPLALAGWCDEVLAQLRGES